ncbi:carboxymuconolactone decarboxylase family protein [Acidihalobacter ferrooxydans]|uniref:carboxymuconolactone decarboxylase family protein n=1 Tax=Acidihalobacter ferrooxydans TaxID=1765967 RepID=UPI0018DC6EAC|nr:carboxymuconolactone decarboxylase family protein [Acidihalobacter ferrooxydans]
MPRAIVAIRNPDITRAFIEKIMMVITAVNGCVYCEWFHARQASSCGMTAREISNLFNLQFHAEATDFELPALLYAQHYAETDRHPDAEMTHNLDAFYGAPTANTIRLFIRMIYFGNLVGNTWDAVLHRLRGRPAAGSSLTFEAVFTLLVGWAMVPVMLLMWFDRRH